MDQHCGKRGHGGHKEAVNGRRNRTVQPSKDGACSNRLRSGISEGISDKDKGRPLSGEAGGLCRSAVSEPAASCRQGFRAVKISRSVRP